MDPDLVSAGDGLPLSSGETAKPANEACLGKDAGLTARETELVTLIARGLTNEEIAQEAHISINTLKTYIRSAYRKMGVVRRSQAVRWGIEHGAG